MARKFGICARKKLAAKAMVFPKFNFGLIDIQYMACNAPRFATDTRHQDGGNMIVLSIADTGSTKSF